MEKYGAQPVFAEALGALSGAQFPGCVGLSVNDTACFGAPSGYLLAEGDVLKLDVWLRYDGFCARVRYTAFVGRPDDRWLSLAHSAARATLAGIERLRAGQPVARATGALRRLLRADGYTLAHPDSGHGLGRFPLEQPLFPYTAEAKLILRPGMVLFFGPCVTAGAPALSLAEDGFSLRTADGQPTCAYGHTVGITDGEPLIFTML